MHGLDFTVFTGDGATVAEATANAMHAAANWRQGNLHCHIASVQTALAATADRISIALTLTHERFEPIDAPPHRNAAELRYPMRHA